MAYISDCLKICEKYPFFPLRLKEVDSTEVLPALGSEFLDKILSDYKAGEISTQEMIVFLQKETGKLKKIVQK